MRSAGWALAALTLIRLGVAAATPLLPDEAYYWVWSRALAGGYLDHPPMVALWIRAGTALAGDGAPGVRLLAPLSAALGSVLLARAAADLLPGRNVGIAAAALLNATLLFGVGAVTMTPDTPLLLFWTATLWALARLHATGRPVWWLAAGGFAGLALDSKYTAVLLAPSVLLWLIVAPAPRRWLATPWPWLAALLAAVLFSPVVAWNAAHGWASFAKQGGRAADWHAARAAQFLGELLAGQIALATPLLAVLFAVGVTRALRAARGRDPAWTLLAALTALPAAIFVEHAFGDRVQANWPAVLYPAAAIAAATRPWRRARPAMALGLALTGAAYLHAATLWPALSEHIDPVAKRLVGWPGFAAAVAEAARAQGAAYVAVGNYGDAAELARLLPPELTVLGAEPRWAQFRLPDAAPIVAGATGLLLRPGTTAEPPDPAVWAEAVRLPDLVRGGEVTGVRYQLYRVTGRAGAGPVVVLPRLQGAS